MRNIKIYSEKDTKELIHREIDKKFDKLENAIQILKIKIIDLDKIIRRTR